MPSTGETSMNNTELASARSRVQMLLPLRYTWGKGIPDLVLY